MKKSLESDICCFELDILKLENHLLQDPFSEQFQEVLKDCQVS